MRWLVALVVLVGVAHADPVRVAVADIDRVLAESKVGKEAGKQLDRERARRQQELDLAAARLKKASERCTSRPDPGCKDAVTRQMQALQQQYAVLEAELGALSRKLADEAMKKISPAIERVAKHSKIDVVVGAAPIYAGTSPVDITAELIAAADDGNTTGTVSPSQLTVMRARVPVDHERIASAARDNHVDVVVDAADVVFSAVELAELQPR
jgi:Skp family chaperone for outer membrane proteins